MSCFNFVISGDSTSTTPALRGLYLLISSEKTINVRPVNPCDQTSCLSTLIRFVGVDPHKMLTFGLSMSCLMWPTLLASLYQFPSPNLVRADTMSALYSGMHALSSSWAM